MKFIAEIDIMPHKELLDPQGKTVAKHIKNIDIFSVEDVRIGKHIKVTLEAADQALAQEIATTVCEKLLANPIMESFHIVLFPVETETAETVETERAETLEAPLNETIEVEISDSTSTF